MKHKKVLLALTVGILAAAPARADWDSWTSSDDPDLFSGCEATVDALGFGASRDKNGHSDNGWGIGTGLSYFITKNFGAGVDTYADAFNAPYLLNFSGIFRFPIPDSRFAAQGFGGFGRQWKYAPQWTSHVGAGIEYRFRSNCGVFTDIREVFPGQTDNYTVVRFGFRFKFL